MPAESQSQQKLFAIAKNNPKSLYKKNKGLLSLSKQTLSEFASTRRKGLPNKVSKVSKGMRK